MSLCKKVGVPMASTEQSMKPSQSLIDDTLFTQYIELQAKVPNYTLDMFGTTHPEQEKEPRESEEEGKDDKEGDDEMDFEKDG
ncbi:hypothetical protein Godav_023568 [Gossypium davidsonii]|uniref:Uncharacterized protein n=1 Tax=Gossypium davidsonii TaxID=34287 RepID=A0A7J8SS94_GOSDV|nr:hypothetical protein [Gossypium davidsonii]